MPRTNKRNTKKGKLKMLLFFLFIAFFTWFLTKFSKDFNATINTSFQFDNLPNKTAVSTTSINNFSFDLTTSGFDFLIYKFKKPIIKIDVSKYYNENTRTIFIPNNDLVKIISSQLKNTKTVSNLSISDLSVILDTIESKKIPIILFSDIIFQNGYKSIDGLKLKPDSISVSGPSLIIDSIQQINTRPFVIKNVKENISEEIELDTFSDVNLNYSHVKVVLSTSVEEFTQKKLVLPIKIINLPDDLNIKLISEAITITFDVSLTEFNSITEESFEAICDYEKRNTNENFIIPELLRMPDRILNIEFKEKKIDYLIFK
jgi:hypothetical protein